MVLVTQSFTLLYRRLAVGSVYALFDALAPMNRLVGQRVPPVLLLVYANAGQARRPVLQDTSKERGSFTCGDVSLNFRYFCLLLLKAPVDSPGRHGPSRMQSPCVQAR